MPYQLVPVIGIIFGTLMVVGLIVVVGIVIIKWGQMHHQTRLKMIESSDPETLSRLMSRRGRYAHLQWGIVLTCLGIALFLGLVVFEEPGNIWWLVPLLVGLGLLIFHFGFIRRPRPES